MHIFGQDCATDGDEYFEYAALLFLAIYSPLCSRHPSAAEKLAHAHFIPFWDALACPGADRRQPGLGGFALCNSPHSLGSESVRRTDMAERCALFLGVLLLRWYLCWIDCAVPR